MTINVLTDPQQDDRIRQRLRQLHEAGRLGQAVAATGIAGGEDELVRIMRSEGPLHTMDRGMLALHLFP